MTKLLLAASLFLNLSMVADEWNVLFDGKTLNGWTEKTKEGSFKVEDGTIVGTMISGKGTTFLCSNKEYSDFELEFDTKLINRELNSGVQIRSRCKDATGKQTFGAVYGPLVEINGKKDSSKSGYIYGQGWKSWISPKDLPNHGHLKATGWNSVRVVAVGNSIKTWINGVFIYETIVPADRQKTNSKGFLGLQVHGIKSDGPYQVSWRNIRIKEISQEKK
jgi:hypothetical protein